MAESELWQAIRDSNEPMRAATLHWESRHGTRKGLSAALMELEHDGLIRLKRAEGVGTDQVLGIEAVIRNRNDEEVDETILNVSQAKDMRSVQRDPRRVFLIHGRNRPLADSMANFLRSIDLRPEEWTDLVRHYSKGSPYIGDLLEHAFDIAQAFVVLMTPDETVALVDESGNSREDGRQARPNVIFEAGMALAKAPTRTVIVEVGELRPFSDIAGRHLVRLDDTDATDRVARRQDLAQRLERAGCPVVLTGTAWHSTGDFRVEPA